jgi:hypothetical protein
VKSRRVLLASVGDRAVDLKVRGLDLEGDGGDLRRSRVEGRDEREGVGDGGEGKRNGGDSSGCLVCSGDVESSRVGESCASGVCFLGLGEGHEGSPPALLFALRCFCILLRMSSQPFLTIFLEFLAMSSPISASNNWTPSMPNNDLVTLK